VPLAPDLLAGWIGAARDLDLRRLPSVPAPQGEAHGAWVAFGSTASGVDGFRRSHAEALLARRVARLTGRTAGTVTRYDDVALLALLTEDLDHARRFVARELGALAGGDEPTRRLVATLRVYFEEGASPARVSRRLGVHENTVSYRLRRAEELLGRPLTERSAELVAALALVDAVGDGGASKAQ
jgi:DNA-binding PucR family transcriptional regulator